MSKDSQNRPENAGRPKEDTGRSRNDAGFNRGSQTEATRPYGRRPQARAETTSTQPVAVEQRVTTTPGGTYPLVELVPRWITRLLVGGALTVLALWAVMWTTRRLTDVIAAFLTSLLLALALEPAVNWIVARRGWKRSRATVLVLTVLIVVCVAVVGSMVPLLISQVQQLVEAAPRLAHTLGTFTERYFHFRLSSHYVTTELSKLSNGLASLAGNLAGRIFGVGVQLFKVVLLMMATLLFTYYLIADGPALRRFLLSFMNRRRQDKALWVWETAIEKTGGYFYSRGILAIISAALMFVALMILGVPYALPLALWMGVFSQFLPTFGSYVGAVVPLFVTLLQSPVKALILLVYVIIYQLFEGHIISPPLTARTMSVNGGLAFGAAFAGVVLYGVTGALLAIPTVAVLQAALITFAQSRRQDASEVGLTAEVPLPPERRTPLGRTLAGRIQARGRRIVSRVLSLLRLRRPPAGSPPKDAA